MADDLLSGQLGNILNFLSATAGLGTAAMGLVDATKAWNGGPSNFGFSHIERALDRFLVAQTPDVGQASALGKAQIIETLKANWLNGVPKADQKAKAKALIHLGLTQGNARALAAAANVNGDLLASLAAKTATGDAPTQAELAVLGQFDAVLMAVLDVAYERGDQLYRNGSKAFAMVISTVLAVLVGWLANKDPSRTTCKSRSSASRNCGPPDFAASLCVGSLRIVQQRLHVLYGRRKCEGRNGGSVPIKRHHVFAPGWAIAEHKDLAPPFGAQVDQIVARTTQVAGEIEIARLERDFARRHHDHLSS
jgi:hypothetical protein